MVIYNAADQKKWADVVEIINGKNQKKVANPKGKYPIYGSGGVIGHADDYLCEAGTTIVGRKGTIGDARKYIRSRIKTTSGQNGIPGGDLKKTPVYLPSLDL